MGYAERNNRNNKRLDDLRAAANSAERNSDAPPALPGDIDPKDVRKVFWMNPHDCGDAFMIMLYATADGSIQEYLWNSRDGVTPFTIHSRDGQKEMQHVHWERDIYAPKFRPPIGMRIFARLTEERAREAAKTNVNQWWLRPDFRERFPDRDEAIEHFAKAYVEDYGGDCPDIVTVDQGWFDANCKPENAERAPAGTKS